ncbi:MAG: hypothetical protein ACPGJS_00825 [Flammeovirgaceae bacterium]
MNLLEIVEQQQKLIEQLTADNTTLINKLEARNEELFQYKVKFGPLTSEEYNQQLRILHKVDESHSKAI